MQSNRPTSEGANQNLPSFRSPHLRCATCCCCCCCSCRNDLLLAGDVHPSCRLFSDTHRRVTGEKRLTLLNEETAKGEETLHPRGAKHIFELREPTHAKQIHPCNDIVIGQQYHRRSLGEMGECPSKAREYPFLFALTFTVRAPSYERHLSRDQSRNNARIRVFSPLPGTRNDITSTTYTKNRSTTSCPENQTRGDRTNNCISRTG